MEQGNSLPRHPQGQHDDLTNPEVLAGVRWQDAEIAMSVARRCFQRWLQTDHADNPTMARLHAFHTHEALHEAARTIGILIETLRVEEAAMVPQTGPPLIDAAADCGSGTDRFGPWPAACG